MVVSLWQHSFISCWGTRCNTHARLCEKKNEKNDHLKERRRRAASTRNDGEEVRGQTEDDRNEGAEFAS